MLCDLFLPISARWIRGGSQEIRAVNLDDLADDEMDLSEDEGGSTSKKSRWDVRKEHRDSTSEADSQSVRSELEIKTMQIQVLQETIRNLQTQLLENKSKEMDRHSKISDLEGKLKEANVKQLLLKTKIATTQSKLSLCATNTSSSKGDSEVDESDLAEVTPTAVVQPVVEPPKTPPPAAIDPREAKVITLVSTFLVVHPHGASIDYIWSYVSRYVPEFKAKLLEEVLQRYSDLFREEVSGIGAKIERNWKFCGYESKDDEKL